MIARSTTDPASGASGKPGLALFDFDGTLTQRDTVLPFLLSVCGGQALPRLSVAAARGFAGDGDARRDAAKAAIIMSALAGRSSAEVNAAGRAYARVVLQRALRPAGRARLEWHRAHGHRLVIVSASLEPYLAVVAELLGVELCLCTRLEVSDDVRLTGSMAGANCRGAEKARRVRAVVEPNEYEVWAYGDSAGDEALLALANHPVWVGKGARRAPPH
jgi:phosphatidylglycerophosphatase C